MDSSNEARLDALTSRLDQLERRNRLQRRTFAGVVVALVVLTSTTLFAQATWAPPGFSVFAADTPALASAVNGNFQWLVENPGAVFLTQSACPAGYTAYEGGQYIRLGTPNLTPVARTLVTPSHRHDDLTGLTLSTTGAHAHSYGDYYWSDTGDVDIFGTPSGDGSGERLEAGRTTGSAGNHTHTPSGRVGPSTGVNGDVNINITGELQHITLRLCVRT